MYSFASVTDPMMLGSVSVSGVASPFEWGAVELFQISIVRFWPYSCAARGRAATAEQNG